jgi:CRP/FNR family cyclic AMP-dependent transcriptional regulator
MASLCLDRKTPQLAPGEASALVRAAAPATEVGNQPRAAIERSTPMTREGPSSFGLRKIALLAGLTPQDLDDLAARCAWRTHRAGQHIISRESRDRDVYMVVSGSVRVTTYAMSGRQTTFRDVHEGDCFGELAAIDGRPRSADVVAVKDTLLASMAPGVFWDLLRNKPAVAERVLTRLCSLVRQLSERVVDLSTLDVQNRLNVELLNLARAGRIEGNVAIIDPAPKHADIASQVSTYREQVTRELSALAKAGILKRAGRTLVVRDLARLARLVNEGRQSA